MKEKVAITGGTGLVGQHLTRLLLKEGYEVVHISRTKNSLGGVKCFTWDYEKAHLEEGALNKCSHLIHLAGAGIADERWTYKRKLVLIASRVDSSTFLCKYVKEHQIPLKTYITSSGINLYDNQNDILHTEDSPGTEGFLSKLVQFWEKASTELDDYCRVCQVRTSVVLDKRGGALPKMDGFIKMHMGSPVGTGKQWMPWIHHEDLSRMFLHLMQNDLTGPFNAVADEQVNNATFMRTIAKVLKKKMFLPKVPARIIKKMYGSMGDETILKGVRASNEKIKSTGFSFNYPRLEEALKEVYQKH